MYGVDIKDLPNLDKKIKNYSFCKSNSKTKRISSLWIKKLQERREAEPKSKHSLSPRYKSKDKIKEKEA